MGITLKGVWLSTQPCVVHDQHFSDARTQARHEQICTGTNTLYEWSKKPEVKTTFARKNTL